MPKWAGFGFGQESNRLLASEADREATQAVLQQAFADQRLMLDEFESRVGRALTARTQGELAQLTKDIPTGPTGPTAPVTGGRAAARPQPNRRGKELPQRHQFRLLPPELCPSCGNVNKFGDGICYRCDTRSISRITGVPDLIAGILVNLPLLEIQPVIEQFLAGAPQEHSAILELTTAVADAGVRIRDTHPNEDVRQSGLRHLSADDIWVLDLTLDVMFMLAGRLPGKSSPWDDDHDWIPRRLTDFDKATHDRHWKRALRQAGAGPAQFRQLRAHILPRTVSGQRRTP